MIRPVAPEVEEEVHRELRPEVGGFVQRSQLRWREFDAECVRHGVHVRDGVDPDDGGHVGGLLEEVGEDLRCYVSTPLLLIKLVLPSQLTTA